MAKNDDQAETPAPKSGAGILSMVLAIAAAFALFPGVPAVFIAGVLAVEYRRVRTKRWLAAAGLSFALFMILGLIVGSTLLYWAGSFAARVWATAVLPDDPAAAGGFVAWTAANAGASWLFVIVSQFILGAPLGFLLTAAYSYYRSYARNLDNEIEGDKFSNERPFGVLDYLNRERETRRIREGYYLDIPETEH